MTYVGGAFCDRLCGEAPEGRLGLRGSLLHVPQLDAETAKTLMLSLSFLAYRPASTWKLCSGVRWWQA